MYYTMRTKTFITLLAAILLVTACTSEENEVLLSPKVKVYASLPDAELKASATEWSVGDVIGVSDNMGHSNIPYIAESTTGSFTSVEGIDASERAVFCAYYPYNNDGESVDFSIIDALHQYTHAPEQIDFMYAPAVTTQNNGTEVKLRFEHKMAKLAISLTDLSNILTAENCTIIYRLSNIATDGTFNTITGEVLRGEATSWLSIQGMTDETTYIILPSDINGNSTEMGLDITITCGDEVRSFHGSLTPELLPGIEYAYHAQLSFAETTIEN